MKILTVGNCQSRAVTKILKSLFKDADIENKLINISLKEGVQFDDWDYVFIQKVGGIFSEFVENSSKEINVFLFPNITFNGFQPDYIYVDRNSGGEKIPNQSSILLNAYMSGLACSEAVSLFNEKFLSLLDYKSYFVNGKKYLVNHLSECGMDGEFYFDKWVLKGAFMYTINHPSTRVMIDVATNLCERANLRYFDFNFNETLNDDLLDVTVFPNYSVNCGYGAGNMLASDKHFYKIGAIFYTLDEFAALSYEKFTKWGSDLKVDTSRMAKFQEALLKYVIDIEPIQTNPYKAKSNDNFWKKSVALTPPSELAPLLEQTITINETSRVATAGSCFAQHIARTLANNGLNYYVAEKAPSFMTKEQSDELGYDLFSARYGNIYTARQLLQLFQRAYGQFATDEQTWLAKSGQYIDPFRPNIGEEFASEELLDAQREVHLAAVRDMFENLDVFVFTLGLTESWVNTQDGAVYPVAPGVISQHANYVKYKFKNFTHNEIREDMIEFLGLLRAVNRNAKVLLTVSPVPLIATYEKEHVLSATTYSKSVLRAVAGELTKTFDFVSYFPSYEIITGSFNKGAYYESDLRTVKPEGVAHVMGVFMDYMVACSDVSPEVVKQNENIVDISLLEEIKKNSEIICDEELIDSE